MSVNKHIVKDQPKFFRKPQKTPKNRILRNLTAKNGFILLSEDIIVFEAILRVKNDTTVRLNWKKTEKVP